MPSLFEHKRAQANKSSKQLKAFQQCNDQQQRSFIYSPILEDYSPILEEKVGYNSQRFTSHELLSKYNPLIFESVLAYDGKKQTAFGQATTFRKVDLCLGRHQSALVAVARVSAAPTAADLDASDALPVIQEKPVQEKRDDELAALIWHATLDERIAALQWGLLKPEAFQACEPLEQIAITAQYFEAYRLGKHKEDHRTPVYHWIQQVRVDLFISLSELTKLGNDYDEAQSASDNLKRIKVAIGTVRQGIRTALNPDVARKLPQVPQVQQVHAQRFKAVLETILDDYEKNLNGLLDACNNDIFAEKDAVIRDIFKNYANFNAVSLKQNLEDKLIDTINRYCIQLSNRAGLRTDFHNKLLEADRTHFYKRFEKVLDDSVSADFLEKKVRPLDLMVYADVTSQTQLKRCLAQVNLIQVQKGHVHAKISGQNPSYFIIRKAIDSLLLGFLAKAALIPINLAVGFYRLFPFSSKTRADPLPGEIYEEWYENEKSSNALLNDYNKDNPIAKELKNNNIAVHAQTSWLRKIFMALAKPLNWLVLQPVGVIFSSVSQINPTKWVGTLYRDITIGNKDFDENRLDAILTQKKYFYDREKETLKAFVTKQYESLSKADAAAVDKLINQPLFPERVSRDYGSDAIKGTVDFWNDIMKAFRVLYQQNPVLSTAITTSVIITNVLPHLPALFKMVMGSSYKAGGTIDGQLQALDHFLDKFAHPYFKGIGDLFIGTGEGELTELTKGLLGGKFIELIGDGLYEGSDSMLATGSRIMLENPGIAVAALFSLYGVGVAIMKSHFPIIYHELLNARETAITDIVALETAGAKGLFYFLSMFMRFREHHPEATFEQFLKQEVIDNMYQTLAKQYGFDNIDAKNSRSDCWQDPCVMAWLREGSHDSASDAGKLRKTLLQLKQIELKFKIAGLADANWSDYSADDLYYLRYFADAQAAQDPQFAVSLHHKLDESDWLTQTLDSSLAVTLRVFLVQLPVAVLGFISRLALNTALLVPNGCYVGYQMVRHVAGHDWKKNIEPTIFFCSMRGSCNTIKRRAQQGSSAFALILESLFAINGKVVFHDMVRGARNFLTWVVHSLLYLTVPVSLSVYGAKSVKYAWQKRENKQAEHAQGDFWGNVVLPANRMLFAWASYITRPVTLARLILSYINRQAKRLQLKGNIAGIKTKVVQWLADKKARITDWLVSQKRWIAAHSNWLYPNHLRATSAGVRHNLSRASQRAVQHDLFRVSQRPNESAANKK